MEISGEYPTASILPYDGMVRYYGMVFDGSEGSDLMGDLLKGIPWENDVTHMFGKRIVTARKVAWFADGNTAYSYSGSVKIPHQWTGRLLTIKERVEELTGEKYNSCLLNLYHHGGEGMGWHSDDEKSIDVGSSIASVSFGAERKFTFKHKATKEVVPIMLASGSLLDMRGETQQCWLHQLPKTKKVGQPRINLTFRKML